MKKIALLPLILIIAMTAAIVTRGQDAKPAPAVSDATQKPQASPQDRIALDMQLCNFQLNGLKEGLLQAQVENKALLEENKTLKEELAKLKK